jgi:uncharacterized protein (TIRG00374 family)
MSAPPTNQAESEPESARLDTPESTDRSTDSESPATPASSQAPEATPAIGSLEDFAKAQGAPTDRLRKRIMFAIKAAISIALIVWIVSGADLAEVFESAKQVHVGWLLFAASLQLLGPWLTAIRWKWMLNSQGFHPTLMYLYKSCLVAVFFKQFMPSILGGDTIRGYDVWKSGANKGLAVTSVVVDRLIGLVALASFAVVALAFLHGPLIENAPGIQFWAFAALASTMLVTWAMFAQNETIHEWLAWGIAKLPRLLGGKINKVYGTLSAYRGHYRTLIKAFLLSIVLQTKVVVFYYAIGRALGLEIGFENWFVIVPVAIFIMLAPISINGVGLRESVFTFLLAEVFTATNSQALAFAWIEYGIFLFFGLAGGLVYAARRSTPDYRTRSGVDMVN